MSRVEIPDAHALLQVQRYEESNGPLSTEGEAILGGVERIRGKINTKLLTNNILSRVKKGKFSNEQEVFNTAKFVQRLSKNYKLGFPTGTMTTLSGR